MASSTQDSAKVDNSYSSRDQMFAALPLIAPKQASSMVNLNAYRGYKSHQQKKCDEKKCKEALRRSQECTADSHAFSYYKHATEQQYHSECCPTRCQDFYIESALQGLNISKPTHLRNQQRRDSQESYESSWSEDSDSIGRSSPANAERQVKFNDYAEVIPKHILRPYRHERRAKEKLEESNLDPLE